MKKTLFPLFLLSLAVLATASPAWAATIMVTTTADENGTGAACSLREAITAANTNATFGGCPAGSAGTNTITFQAGLMGTITLGSALPTITQPLVIAGPGAADITVDGGADTFDGFVASGIASLQVSGLTLTDFLNAIDATGVDVALTAVVITSSGEGGAVTTNLGAVKVIGGDLTLTGVTLSNNTGYLGGAVSYEPQAAGDSLTVVNSTFTGNTANTGTGGALLIQAYASQTNSITGSTFANNTGSSNGAIMVWSTGAFVSTTTIAHSTFSANAATNTAGADAIYGYGDSQVSITYTTFSGHSSDTAGSTAGILNVTNGADMVLAQSIIANNPAGGTPRECTAGVGTTFTGNQNLTADAFCPGRIAAATNVNATLASNGGPTQTHALTAGSNAIDVVAVSGSCVPGSSADQRGAARANGASAGGSACDLGAYEFASTVTPTAVAMAQPTAAVFPSAILLWVLALAMLGLTVTAVVKHGG